MALSDYPSWQPYTLYYTGSKFQHVNKLYEVLQSHKSGPTFDPYNSNITVTSEGGSGGGGGGTPGRGISSAQVNTDGDLIITYTDSTMENAGHVRGMNASESLISQRLLVTGPTTFSQTAYPIDTTLPVLLVVNHLSYSNQEAEPAFSVSGSTVTWNNADEGFDVETQDDVVVTYFKVLV